MRENDELLNRATGCLLGLAVGDGLGAPVEGSTGMEIRNRFGLLTEMTGSGRLNLRPGETTDDTAQTMAMAESIASCGGFDADDIAFRFTEWFRMDGRGVGRHTSSVLSLIAGGEDWEKAALETQARNPDSSGNGSLMRCAPVALSEYKDSARLIRNSRLSSRITHPHPDCQWSCVFLNLLIAELLKGNERFDALKLATDRYNEINEASPEILRRSQNAFSEKTAGKPSPTAYVLDTLECSIWLWLHHSSFEETLIAAVNLGGDADTIGAVTGALAGCTYGAVSIPDRWLVHIQNAQRLGELAEALVISSRT
ncbi:MAG: ADP-ribosylglycohydrolase family protein [Thermoleophilia bacterium]